MSDSTAPDPTSKGSAPPSTNGNATAKKTSASFKGSSAPKYYRQITSKATSTQANRTVLMCVGLGVGILLIARVSGTPGAGKLNDPGDLIKIGVGAGATTVALMVIAEVSPDVAIRLAWLILVGAALTYGVDFARALQKGTLNPGVPMTPVTLHKDAKSVGKVTR